ncbi:fasciclin domain-containing protein [Micromonospora sp. NPDC126480]|uniref:fasciclin domain-containing protein n=1 Tax=Micromonospora sp. NPDC126480 TaxID=3155312 RepID=UPI00333359F4
MDPFVTSSPGRHPASRPGPARRPDRSYRFRRSGRRLAVLTGVVLSLALAACSGGDGGGAAGPSAVAGASASPVTGPLCDALPSGSEPGNPAALASQPPAVALQWIPVLTTFEAAVRAAGLADLHAGSEITILAPTDDAFAAKFSGANLDRLLLSDKDTLRGLLREHLVAGSLSLADLAVAGQVTSLAGRTLTVTGGGTGVRLADEADTVCADYRAARARIHVINRVLGDLPTTAGEDDHPAH